EYYASVNLDDFDIPTKYQELEFIIKISRSMLQIKKLLSVTISRFKQMKNKAEKEKFAHGKVAIPARQQEYRSFQKPSVPKMKKECQVQLLIQETNTVLNEDNLTTHSQNQQGRPFLWKFYKTEIEEIDVWNFILIPISTIGKFFEVRSRIQLLKYDNDHKIKGNLFPRIHPNKINGVEKIYQIRNTPSFSELIIFN
ncbi:1424_t:CDS:2, partial [Funneliformis geosporum]